MNKTTNFATDNNLIVNLKAESHSTWFGYSGVFLFGLWLAGSFVLPLGPAQAKPADTTPPTVPGTPTAGGAYTKVCNLNWTWGVSSDSGSGLAGYQYILYRNSSFITSGNTASTSYSNGCFGSGTYALYVRAYDIAGNYSAYASGSIIIDTAAPTCSVSASGSTLTATCSDSGSGCTQSTQTQTATTTGTYTFTFNDNAGNSGSCSYAYTAPPSDTTPPTFTISPTATVTGPASGTVIYSDPSGVAQVAYCILTGSGVLGTCAPYQYQASATINFSLNTPTTVVCHNGSDTLDNWRSTSCSTFYARPPAVLNGDFYISGAYTSGSVGLQWAYFSSLASGFDIYRNSSYIGSRVANYPSVSSYSYTDSTCPVAGNYTYQIIATNSSGAATGGPTATTYKYSCDVAPPTGSVIINQGNLLTGSQTVYLDISCSDSGSGCNTYDVYTDSSCTGSPVSSGTISYSKLLQATLPISGYTMYASVKLTDLTGNAACMSDSIYYDVTPPTGTISINSGASFTTSTSVNLNLSCTDNSSDFTTNPLAFKINHKWLSWLSPIIDWLGFNKVAQAIPAGPNKLGCEMMQFSNDGVTYSTQEAYTTTKAWTLSACSNNRTVYVKYLDAVGNAAAFSSSINCDNTAPTCGSWSPASSTPHASGGTAFTLSGSTDAGSGIATAGGACTTGPNNGDTCTVTISDNAGNTRACTSPPNVIGVPPTACTSVGVSNVNADAVSGYTKVSPARFQCYGSAGGASGEYRRTVYYNGVYQYQNIGLSYLDVPNSYGNGAYTVFIEPHNSAGYAAIASGSTYIDTGTPVVSVTLAKSQGILVNSPYYNQKATSTNANDPMFIVTFSDSGSGMNTSVNDPTCDLRNTIGSIVGSCTCTGATSTCTAKVTPGGNVNRDDYKMEFFTGIKNNAGNLYNGSVSFSVNNQPPTILKVQ